MAIGARRPLRSITKEEADHTEKQKVTGWTDPLEEKTGFVEAACKNYEILVEDKREGKDGGARPSNRYEM